MTKKEKMLAFADDVYKIQVTGRNIQVTEAMKDYAVERVQKISRFSDKIIDITITMDIQKLDHRVDITMHANHIKIKSHGISNDMYASIDLAVKRIETQLKRYLDRLHDHQAKPLKLEEVPVDVITSGYEQEIIDDLNETISARDEKEQKKIFTPHRIVHKETKPLKTLSREDALMKMELSQDAFMIYRSEDTKKIQVIYRRDDGHYGIIQPEKA